MFGWGGIVGRRLWFWKRSLFVYAWFQREGIWYWRSDWCSKTWWLIETLAGDCACLSVCCLFEITEKRWWVYCRATSSCRDLWGWENVDKLWTINYFERRKIQKVDVIIKLILQQWTEAALTLNNLYDTICMIQLVWLCKIVNSYKLDVKIFVWYNFWKIGWVLFLPTCMKEIDQSYFTFRNAELFWRKI